MVFQTNASGVFQGHLYIWYLFNHSLRFSYFPKFWKNAKTIILPKPRKDPTIFPNLRPISLLATTGKFYEKVILKMVQSHIGVRDLLNANQLGFRARHNTTLQCVILKKHVTLNFNNNMSTTAVFLDTEKAFDTTWYLG
jgi:hypothetical protein